MESYKGVYETTSSTGIAAGLIIVFVILGVIALACTIFYLIALVKVFKKAGRPGWAAIIPYYNTYTMLDIAGYNWYYVFIYLLPLVPFIGKALTIVVSLFGITSSIKLAKSFGKSTGFGVGIAFLGIVFIPMLAFDKNVKYVGKTVNGDIDFNDLF